MYFSALFPSAYKARKMRECGWYKTADTFVNFRRQDSFADSFSRNVTYGQFARRLPCRGTTCAHQGFVLRGRQVIDQMTKLMSNFILVKFYHLHLAECSNDNLSMIL